MNCACTEWTNQVADSEIWTNQEPCVITRNGTDQPTDKADYRDAGAYSSQHLKIFGSL